MSYSGRFQNSILTKQDQILKSNLIKDWRNGMYHNIPISATFNVFKYLNLTASFNFTDRMYTNKVMRMGYSTVKNSSRHDLRILQRI